MRKQKLQLFLALALSGVLVFAGCGSAPQSTAPPPAEPPAQAAPAPAEPAPAPPEPPAAEPAGVIPGEYYGIGPGRNGAVVVKVTMGEDSIDGIEVISENETYTVGSEPMRLYPSMIVDNQSLSVDMISGATISSGAFLVAVRDAVKQSGADPAKFNAAVKVDVPHEDTTADVVVIGAGGAGMTAAITAANQGKKVVLLEKLGILGGTSSYSIEAFGAVGDKTHTALGSSITSEMLAKTLTDGNPNGTAEGFSVLANNNGAAADWLRSIGAQMSVAGGQTSVTSSREVGRMGSTIVAALIAECKKAGVDIRLNSAATELVMENGAASGVKVSTKQGDYTISAGAVVVATGGFGANNGMVAENYPALKDYDSSCSPGATGDGHLMAKAAGAELKNMDYIRVNFTYATAPNHYFYYTGSLFNTGAIFVNNDGKRFVNDQGAYGVGLKVVEQGGSGWAIFDNSLVEGVEGVRSFAKLGLYQSADSIEELADLIGVNKEGLAQTIEDYKKYVANGTDEEFKRAMLNMTFDEAPYYACKMTARVQGTFGGIDTDTNAQVLNASGEAVPGLFAAGECANDGTWGANPAAVNIVFGRIAGENAAAYVK